MKRAIVLLTIFLMMWSLLVPVTPAWAGGWHHHGGWWWPGAIIGGLALGAVAIATAPLWAFAPPPAPVAPAVVYAQPTYAYAAPTTYAAPAAYSAPPAYSAPAVRREVVYSNGRYVLYGDGVTQPWQWVWVPAAPPPPPPPPR